MPLIWSVLGGLCLLVGAVGIVLPVLPTTPFVLLAAGAFARGNPALAARLEAHPRFGPMVREWRARRVIPPHAKVIALTMMAAVLVHLTVIAEAPLAGRGSGGRPDGGWSIVHSVLSCTGSTARASPP